ncbi:MAG: lactate utilization protein [Acidobacteriota bacterium]|nr:lactate utilization protein [Acidobacteriota bacterium]
MTARESILGSIRTALNRRAGQNPGPPPAVAPCLPVQTPADRAALFAQRLEKLAGHCFFAPTPAAAGDYVRALVQGKRAIAAPAPFLIECGITGFPEASLDQADIGITSADYALADTGTLVLLASASQPRLVSLLPPVHVAVFPRSAILTSLDELFAVLPNPAEQTSSMVLITGPSRTADIEQILVRGVHGPGAIHAVIVD